MLRLSLTLSFLIGHIVLFAQENFPARLYVEPSIYAGSVLPQNSCIRYLVKEHLRAGQLNLGIRTDGSKEWHQYLNFPALGVGYHFSNLGNREVFGNLHAVYGTAALKMFPQKFRINLEHNLTAGAGFLTKKFDPEENPLNMAFGSGVVFFLQYALLVPVRLGKSVELFAGPCFSHVSAAKIIQPNLGLHMIQVRAGGRYAVSPPEYKSRFERKPLSPRSRHQVTLSFSGGIKQYSRLERVKSAIFAVSPEYSFKISHVFGVGAGLDFYIDNTVRPFLKQHFNEEARFDQLFHATIQAGGILYIGDLTFLVQPGTYLYQNFKGYHGLTIYKLGFRYQISERISAHALLKAHWLAKADFLELGMGWSFLKNKER